MSKICQNSVTMHLSNCSATYRSASIHHYSRLRNCRITLYFKATCILNGIHVGKPTHEIESFPRKAQARQAVFSTSGSLPPHVVLTREQGKNGELKKALESLGLRTLEMPLVETSPGPDRDALPQHLASKNFDWICLTSPESAGVFLKGWEKAGKPDVDIAVVGKGTAKVLEGVIEPKFTPTVANAEHFAPELPFVGSGRVLYPASCKASSELQRGLQKRGFSVTRLNTYDTITVSKIEESMLSQARQADVVAVASPSAVKAWVATAGKETADRVSVACIGSTSARAAENLGLQSIFWPEKPGIEGFVDAVQRALVERSNQSVT